MAGHNRQGREALPLIIHAAVVAILMLLATPAVGRAQNGQWQFGSAPSFSSGKYGTDARTEVLHTPITARRLFGDGDVTFVFPITCIWGDGGVTVVNGSPVRQQRLANGTAGRAATSSRRRWCWQLRIGPQLRHGRRRRPRSLLSSRRT